MQMKQLKQRLNMLLEILSEQLKIHRQLINLTQKERSAITAYRTRILDDVISEKNYLAKILRETEHRRSELMLEIGEDFEITPHQLTLKRLSEMVDAEMGQQLLDVREQLLNVMLYLQKENNNNKQLMAHFVSLVDNSIHMLGTALCHDPTYIQNGQFAMEQGGGLILSKKL